MTGSPSIWSGDVLRLAVRVTARAGHDALAGTVVTADGRAALAVRVAASPVEGAANQALIALLASKFQVPKSAIRILSGETSRLKIVEIAGASNEALERLIG